MADRNEEEEPLLKREVCSGSDAALPIVLSNQPASCGETFRKYVTVEPALFINFLAFVIYMSTFSQYVYYAVGKKYDFNADTTGGGDCSPDFNSSSPQYILQQKVQAESAKFMMIQSIVYIIPAVILTIIMGPYSDRTGRKFPMVLSLVGSTLRMFVIIIVVAFELDIYYLLIAVGIDGMCGGIPALCMAMFAYVSDVTTRDQRPLRIFLVDLTIYVATCSSSFISGYLLTDLGFLYTMLVVQVLYVIPIFIVILYLRETISTSDNVPLFDMSHIREMVRLFGKDDGSNRLWKLRLTIVILGVVCAVDLGGADLITLNLLNSPLCFTAILLGYYSSMTYILKCLLGAAFLKLFISRLRETGLLMVGCLSTTSAYILLAFATTKPAVFIVPIVGSLSSPIIPMARTLASKLVKPQEQGAVFGSVAIAQNLAVFVGSSLFNLIYTQTILIFHGIVFLIYAGCFLLSFILGGFLHRGMKSHSPAHLDDIITENTVQS